MIMLTLAMVAPGCSKRNSRHPGVQINDSLMYVSANPITGKPVTFWHTLSEPRRKVLREALAWRYGPPGITITPEGRDPVILSEVEVSASRVTRKLTVKQGDTVCHDVEHDVMEKNLETLVTCIIESTDWKEIELTEEDIFFCIDYYGCTDIVRFPYEA